MYDTGLMLNKSVIILSCQEPLIVFILFLNKLKQIFRQKVTIQSINNFTLYELGTYTHSEIIKDARMVMILFDIKVRINQQP
jgi:hypothetical protein